MNKKILLSLGIIVATTAPIAAVVSCTKATKKPNTLPKIKNSPKVNQNIIQKPNTLPKIENSPKINQNIIRFTLNEDNLQMFNFGGDARKNGPKNYPYTMVAQNAIITKSNSTFDYTKKKWKDIIQEVSGAKIDGDQIKDIFSLGQLINESKHNIISGMGLQQNWEFSKPAWDAFMANFNTNLFSSPSPGPDAYKLTIDTYFKTQWPNGVVKDNWTKDDYYNQIKNHIDDKSNEHGVLLESSTSPYLKGKHIYLYNNDQKIDLNADAPLGALNLTIKIED